MDFDHKNKRLKIEIMESMESKNTDVGGKKDKRTARSLAGLSGGERSYRFFFSSPFLFLSLTSFLFSLLFAKYCVFVACDVV